MQTLREKFSENSDASEKSPLAAFPSAFVSVTTVSGRLKKTRRKAFLLIKKLKRRAEDSSKMTSPFTVNFDLE